MRTLSRLVALVLLVPACCNKLDDSLISPQVVAMWTTYDATGPHADMKTKMRLLETGKTCLLMADLPSKSTKDSTMRYCANQTKNRFSGAGIQTTWGGTVVPSDRLVDCLALGSTWSTERATSTLFSLLGIHTIDCSGVAGAEKTGASSTWKLKHLSVRRYFEALNRMLSAFI